MARWLTVLDAFSSRPEWGIRDLAAATGLSRSSVHRIVREMTSLGLLAPAPTSGRSEVGPTLIGLALALSERVDVVRFARPVLDSLRDETGETAILTLYDRGRRRFRAVAAAESTHQIRYIWESLQDWNDLQRGASGKGILAFLSPDEQAAVLAAALPAGGDGGGDVARRALQADLDRARAHGTVISHGERFPGAVGVAAPIHDRSGRVVGSVLLGWPDNRTDPAKEEAAARSALRAATRISSGLSHAADRPDD